MDYSPPPLFKQGPSAFARLLFFVALALALLVADARFKTLSTVREVIGTMLYPLQRIALVPRDTVLATAEFFSSGAALRSENEKLSARNLQLALEGSQAAQLTVENNHLRALLQLTQRATIQAVPAEVEYDTRDPFTHKVIIDKGMQADLQLGAPVVSESGVVGQVTRVYPMQSEVTLISDKDQAVPVQVLRSGVRSVIFGTAQGATLDLRFVPNGADIQVGDELVTSGLDGVYPAGLPVAKVIHVDRQADTSFAQVICVPIAPIGAVRQLLVLHYQSTMLPRPPEEVPATPLKRAPAAKASAPAKGSASAVKGAKAPKKAAATKPAAPAVTHKPAAAAPASTARGEHR